MTTAIVTFFKYVFKRKRKKEIIVFALNDNAATEMYNYAVANPIRIPAV